MTGSRALPVVDVAPLAGGGTVVAGGAAAGAVAASTVAEQIQAACRDRGFFYVTGHGVPAELLDELAAASAEHPADFTSRRLSGLDLSGLDLSRAVLRAARLNKTRLSGARLDGAILD